MGFLLGVIEPLFFSTKDWYATDLVFVVRPGSYAGYYLMSAFEHWYRDQASRCPGRLIPLLSNSSGCLEVDRFYDRRPLTKIGSMYSETIQ